MLYTSLDLKPNITTLTSGKVAEGLYHISFSDKLPSILNPRTPEGMDTVPQKFKEQSVDELVKLSENDYAKYVKILKKEPLTERVSVSSSIEGCIIGILPNIVDSSAGIIGNAKGRPLDIWVYSVVYTPGIKMITDKELTRCGLIWDAHLTKEHWLLGPVTVQKEYMIQVPSTQRFKGETHPFNMRSLPKVPTCGNSVRYTVKKIVL